MVALLGGTHGRGFQEFHRLFVLGYLALQAKASSLVAIVQTMARRSPFPCFENADPVQVRAGGRAGGRRARRGWFPSA
jgi:phosphatidylinositol kinase/protein kinase (PI-3  family)